MEKKMETSERIRKRDDRLLKNEKSWRRAKIGAVILILFWIWGIYMFFQPGEDFGRNEKFLSVGWLLFWVVMFDTLNLRIRHIESIKYYRNQTCSKQREKDERAHE